MIDGVNVAAGEVVSVRLADSAGVKLWSLTQYGVSDQTTFPTIAQATTPGGTATFTAPASPATGWALIIQSQIGVNALGHDANGTAQASYAVTFGVYLPTTAGGRVGALNETTEGSAEFGWVTKLNDIARASGSASTATINTVRVPWKGTARVVTASNITLSGTQTIDGVSAGVGDRVLVAGQTDAKNNGIYVVASGAWSRAADMSTSADCIAGSVVVVSEGATWANTKWTLVTQAPITLDTTALVFSPDRAKTVVSLNLVKGVSDGELVSVVAYSTLGDGGGGVFAWSSTSTETEDHGIIFTPTGLSTGRWKRQNTGHEYYPEWFGAIGDLGALSGLAITSGQNTFTKAGLTSADIGKELVFEGAGASGGQLVTSITNVAGSTITLANNASTTVASGGFAFYYTNDSTAIQYCLDAAFAARLAIQSSYYGGTGLTSVSSPTVHFSKRGYGLASALVSPGGIQYRGSRSTLWAPGTINIITGVHYGDSFYGINFQGGANQILIETGNTDTTTINTTWCEFISPADSGIRSNSTSQSTQLSCRDSKFWIVASAAHAVYQEVGDGWHIDNCWVTTLSTSGTFVVGAPGTTENPIMHVSGLLGVPNSTSAKWFVHNGGSLVVSDSRCGGEGSGAASVYECNAAPQSSYPVIPRRAVFRNCFLSSAAASAPFKFYRLPNLFEVDGCGGFYGIDSAGAGIYLDATIPNGDRTKFGTACKFIINGNALSTMHFDSASDQAVSQIVLANERQTDSGSIHVEDRILAIYGGSSGYGLATSTTNTTNGNSTDKFGNTTGTVVATANGALRTYVFATALSGVASGLYTARFKVRCLDNPVRVQFTAGDTVRTAELAKSGTGWHIVNVPFYFISGTSNQGLGYAFRDLANGTNVHFGEIVLYKGDVKAAEEWETILVDSVPSHANATPYAAGAVLKNRSAADGEHWYWRNNTAGTDAGGAESWEPSSTLKIASADHLEIGYEGALASAGAIRMARSDSIGSTLLASRRHDNASDLHWLRVDNSESQYFGSGNSSACYIYSGGIWSFLKTEGVGAEVWRFNDTPQALPGTSGSDSTPEYSWTGDGDTGMRRVGADDASLNAGGSKAFEWSKVSGAPRVGWFGATPVARPAAYTQTYSTADRTLSAYTSDPESSAYTGAADGEAKLADLNALRVAYENLRAFTEDLAQLVNAMLDDDQAYGLKQ